MIPPFGAWAGPKKPKALLVGEAFGEGEDTIKQPFAGESGKELFRMLGEAFPDHWPSEHARVTDMHRYGLAWVRERGAWLESAGIAFTNVLNLRPPGNKLQALSSPKKELPNDYPPLPAITRGLYLRPEYLGEIRRLEEEIETAAPNVIIALGNTACWALVRSTSISSIRGSTTTTSVIRERSYKCLPTYHPAGVLYQWSWRPIVVADLMKARREMEFPEIRRPRREILVNGTLEEYSLWTDLCEYTIPLPKLLACDIETANKQITTIGFATSPDSAMVIPFAKQNGSSYWKTHNEEMQAWRFVERLLRNSYIPKVFQNGLYDLQYLLRMGFRPQNVLEDTMLLHHSLYPELQKGLGFLGSIYTDESSWKLMRRHRPDTEKRDE